MTMNRRDFLLTGVASQLALAARLPTWARGAEAASEKKNSYTNVKFENPLCVTIHWPDATHNCAHDPTIEWYGGKFWVAWQGGPMNHEGGVEQGIHYATSQDFAHWTATKPLFLPEKDHVLYAAVLWAHDGRLWLFYLDNDPPFRKRGRGAAWLEHGPLKLSRFDGQSWSEPVVIMNTPMIGSTRVAASVTNKPIIIPRIEGEGTGNRIVLPLQALNDAEDIGQCAALMSDDGGATWRESKRVPSHEDCLMEPSIVRTPDGRLVMYMRNDKKKPVVWRSVSSDRAETWSRAEPTEVKNPAKTCVRQLESGHYAMMFNDPKGPGGRRNMSLALSPDAFQFTTVGRVDLQSNGFRISYPDFIEHDGRIYSVTSRCASRKSTGSPNVVRGQVIRLFGLVVKVGQ